MEPIVVISKNSEFYPKSLRTMGDLAPDTIYAQGDTELLNQPMAAFICNTEVTDSNAIKVGKMSEQIENKSHWIFRVDDTIADFSLLRCRDAQSRPVIILNELLDDYSEEFGELKASILEEIVEDGGLLASFHYDDEVKQSSSQLIYDIMAVLADVVAVPMCSKKDYAIRRTMDYAKELGKKVLVNKEDLINLKK